MGIPKFYRWISERYPCLSEKIREYQIPEFDNLYLDMNGIIHSCSHPNDEDIHLRIPEKNIFTDIFQYIDFLLKMIKPRKTFFMAVDGVAPRAKMNQQRGRRFRTAKMAEDQEAEAIRKGESLPSQERFDSNCITPGTEFMARLHLQLQFFIKVKVSTDPVWQRKGLTIILSGHDVPGEGEHKIMDYIRHIRSQPDYDPDTRHCLYGLDADLIMLGLSTHELRFSLLREEVKFTRPKKNNKKDVKRKSGQPTLASKEVQIISPMSTVNESTSYSQMLQKEAGLPAILETAIPHQEESAPPIEEEGAKGTYRAPLPEKTTFLLLHLSLLRDYIDEEFQTLKTTLKDHPTVTYDLEKVIDDWILLSILVGNDFVPHLPMLHIVKGAFPMLYTTYASLLPTLGGYLNENGTLHLGRFEIFLQTLSEFDLEVFRETYDDMKYMESKTGRKITLGVKMFEAFETGSPDEEEEITSSDLKALVARTEAETGVNPGAASATASEFYVSPSFFVEDDSEDFRLEFLQYKRNYYMEKMGMEEVTKDSIRGMAEEYVRAIQWVLLYYYKGVSSWGWFYPHHYAPFCSDIHHLETYNMEFVKGKPFKPFEQLLGVLPSQSGKLLPKCFHNLMTDAESPILDFYPKDFENDLNGKRNDWEAVVLIPFIDESRLIHAMEQQMKLTPEESHRNSRGMMHYYTYSRKEGGEIRSIDGLFKPLANSHVTEKLVKEVEYNESLLPKGLHSKAKKDKFYQGFPTLKTIAHTSCLDKQEIKVFDFVTREESLVLTLKTEPTPQLHALAKKLIGKNVWVNWPHLTLGLVTGVSNHEEKLIRQHNGPNAAIVKDPKFSSDSHLKMLEVLTDRHLKYKGIHLGECDVIVWAKTMEGRRIHSGKRGELLVETQWSQTEQYFTLATTLYSERVWETFFLDRMLPKTFMDLLHVGDSVICIADESFGSLGTIQRIDKKQEEVSVEVNKNDAVDESFDSVLRGVMLKSRVYYSSADIANMLKLPGYTIARLTGTVYLNCVSPKFNKRNLEVRGYSRKAGNQWLYSLKAVELFKEYAKQFPEVIGYLNQNSNEFKESFSPEEFFPQDTQSKTANLLKWIEEKGLKNLPRVPINSNILDDEDVCMLWKHIYSKKAKSSTSRKFIKVRPHELYKAGLNRGCVGAEGKGAEFEVLDRVVCTDPSGPIPLGQKGTVIGVQNPIEEERQEEEAFRSTSATVLKTLLVLPDPAKAIFEEKDKEEEIRTALLTMLNVSRKETFPSFKPKILIFYPFQLLNISHHHRKRSQLQYFQQNQSVRPHFQPRISQGQAQPRFQPTEILRPRTMGPRQDFYHNFRPPSQSHHPRLFIPMQIARLPVQTPGIEFANRTPPFPRMSNQIHVTDLRNKRSHSQPAERQEAPVMPTRPRNDARKCQNSSYNAVPPPQELLKNVEISMPRREPESKPRLRSDAAQQLMQLLKPTVESPPPRQEVQGRVVLPQSMIQILQKNKLQDQSSRAQPPNTQNGISNGNEKNTPTGSKPSRRMAANVGAQPLRQ